MSRLHYGLSFLMWLEFCISAINGVLRCKRGVYIKKGTTGKINFWLNKSYKPKLHLFSLAAPCYLVASFNRILYFQVPALHYVLSNTHRSLLGKGSDAKGTVTHHCQVRGAMVLHFLSLVIVSVPAVKLFHFSFSLRFFCIFHRPAKMSQVHIYPCITLLCTPDIFLAFINFLSISSTIYLNFKAFNNWTHRNPLVTVQSDRRNVSFLLQKKTLPSQLQFQLSGAKSKFVDKPPALDWTSSRGITEGFHGFHI